MSLVEFLRARLGELERRAEGSGRVAWLNYRNADGSMHHTTVAAEAGDEWVVDGQIATGWTSADVIYDEREVLAEVAAKRRLIREAFAHAAVIDGEWGCCHEEEQIEAGMCPDTHVDNLPILRLLALPYADHPDYREEWKP